MTPLAVPNYYPFVIELFIATALFVRPAVWRRSFRLLAIPAVALIGFAYTSAYALSQSGGPFAEAYLAMYYLICVALVVAAMVWCTSVSWLESLIVVVAGYAVQHVASDLTRLVLLVQGDESSVLYSRPNLPWTLGCYLIIYAAAYGLIGRRFTVDHDKVRSRALWVALAILVLVLTTMCNFLLALILPNRLAVLLPGQMEPTGLIYDLLCTVMGLVILMLVSTTDRLYGDLMVMRQIDKLKDEHYELTRENIELINIKCHDIRKNIASLYAGGTARPSREMVREVEDSIRIYDAMYHTGNEAMDALLSEKGLYCTHNDIRLTAMVDGQSLGFLDRSDLYSLFGNILDNAIEAVRHIDEPNKRCINLTVGVSGRLLSIQEENYYIGNLEFKDGLPKTSKGDARYHGFGMRSIAWQVRKYGGEMTVTTDDHVFALDIVVPLPGNR